MGTKTLISSQSPQNTSSPQFKLVVTEDTSKSTATTARFQYSFYYLTDGYPAYVSARPYTIKINGSVVKTGSVAVNGVTASSTTIFSNATVDVPKIDSTKDVAISFEVEWGVTWTGVSKAKHSASGTLSISAKTYTVSYNANNGTGAPVSQTKTGGKDLTLSSTKPTRTGYTFKNWNTKSDGTGTSYSSGGTYKTNASATLYAQWTANTYQVTYNANNGSGAPSAQTKTYGVSLKLSSTKPTRSGYNFVAWNTKSDGTGTTYSSGGSYTANAAVTLYAVWQVSYYPPTITGLSAVRCTTSAGTTEDIYNGTYAKIKFNWSCNQNKGTNNLKSITIDGYTVPTTAITGKTEGSVTYTLPNKTYTPETSHRITIVVTDAYESTTVTVSLTSAKYLIDFKAGGKGVAIGGVADKDNAFKCYLPMESTSLITAAGFRLNGRTTNIGTMITKDISTAVSVPSYGETTTAKALGSISLPIGTWVITGSVQFAGKSGGVRLANLSTAEASTGYGNQHAVRDGSNDSYDKVMQVTYIHANTSEETIYLNAAQNSGSAINCKGWIRAVRIA